MLILLTSSLPLIIFSLLSQFLSERREDFYYIINEFALRRILRSNVDFTK